jgi:hypothetical protein
VGKVNVILPGGRVVSVDEGDATELRRETTEEQTSRQVAASNEERSSGVGEGLKAFGEGLADTATLGLYGKVASAANPEYGRDMAIRGQERSGARGLGELAAFAAPTGLLGDAAKAGSELSGLGVAARVGESVGGIGGRALEGGIIGAGAHIASTNVTGDPLTIEGFAESAGLGAILQLGAGAIGDRLTNKAWMASKAIAEDTYKIADTRAQLDLAQSGERLFEHPPDSYTAFREAHGAAQDAEVKAWKANETANDKWEDFNSSSQEYAKLVGGKGFGKTLNEIRANFITTSATTDLELMERKGWTFEQMVANKEMTSQLLDQVRGELEQAGRLRRAGNFEGSMQQLQGIRAKLRVFEPEGISVPDLPQMPPDRYPNPGAGHVDLPKSFESFVRMKPETIERLAAEVDPQLPEAGKLAGELGVEPGATAGETLDGIHRRMGEYTRAIDTLTRQAEEEAASRAAASDSPASYLKRAQGLLKKGVSFAVAAKAGSAIGGTLGYFLRPAIGAAVGRGIESAMTGAEDLTLGGALVAGKKGLASKVQQLVAKYGEPTGRAITGLGPVTAWLANNLFTGERDSERDPRKLAVKRIREVQAIARGAGDTGYAAVDALGMLGHPADIATKLHQLFRNGWEFLASRLPVDNGRDTSMFVSHWLPSWSDSLAFAHRLEALLHPLQAVARTMAGGGHPAAAELLHACWPGTMQLTAEEMAFAAPDLAGITYHQSSGHSVLFQTALSGLSDPVTVTTLQGLYMAPQIAAGGDRSVAQSNPTGRPAAVQSKLANTNVSALTQ